MFSKKFPSRCISSCQQHTKPDQFSQQNTPCRTAFCRTASWVLLKDVEVLCVGLVTYNLTVI